MSEAILNALEAIHLTEDPVPSGGLGLGEALIMDSRHSELLIVDGFSVEVAYSGDDFSKNLVTIRGEMRVIPIFRTALSAWLG